MFFAKGGAIMSTKLKQGNKKIGKNIPIELLKKLKVRVQLIPENSLVPKIHIESPGHLYELLKEEAKLWDRERFLSIMLNTNYQIIGIDEVCVGCLNAALVHPREVFKSAILANAAAIILIHNHPSGNPEPSKEDVEYTEQLKKAAGILDIELLDHLIIGGDSYSSFSQNWFQQTDLEGYQFR